MQSVMAFSGLAIQMRTGGDQLWKRSLSSLASLQGRVGSRGAHVMSESLDIDADLEADSDESAS